MAEITNTVWPAPWPCLYLEEITGDSLQPKIKVATQGGKFLPDMPRSARKTKRHNRGKQEQQSERRKKWQVWGCKIKEKHVKWRRLLQNSKNKPGFRLKKVGFGPHNEYSHRCQSFLCQKEKGRNSPEISFAPFSLVPGRCFRT